jgi:hypothetical protein
MFNQNQIIERILELREQGEIVTRISKPRPSQASEYECTLSGPFEFYAECSFDAHDQVECLEVWSEATLWVMRAFLDQSGQPMARWNA